MNIVTLLLFFSLSLILSLPVAHGSMTPFLFSSFFCVGALVLGSLSITQFGKRSCVQQPHNINNHLILASYDWFSSLVVSFYRTCSVPLDGGTHLFFNVQLHLSLCPYPTLPCNTIRTTNCLGGIPPMPTVSGI